jgi:hypothetical protein
MAGILRDLFTDGYAIGIVFELPDRQKDDFFGS